MRIFAECLSPHVAPVRADHMALTWNEPVKEAERARVIAWTCDCRAAVYELCQKGGVAYVRRSVRRNGAVHVHETYRWPLREAGSVWAALLRGEAR